MTSSGDARQTLAQAIVAKGTQAFDLQLDAASRASGIKALDSLLQQTPTPALVAALNSLIGRGAAPEWLKPHLLARLTLLPLRPDGVEATLEFVFSMHPSSSVRLSEAAEPQKRGANITQEALTVATRLIAKVPAASDAETWYAGVAPQLLALLDGERGLELVKVAAYVIGFGILGQRQLGAPGTPGWTYLADPLLSNLNPSRKSVRSSAASGAHDVIDLTADEVIVSSYDLSSSLRRLIRLITSHPNAGLSKRLLSPVLLSLWALASWPKATPAIKQGFCEPAKELLLVYLKLTARFDVLSALTENLMYDGAQTDDGRRWRFKQSTEAIDIVVSYQIGQPFGGGLLGLEALDYKAQVLVEVLKQLATEADVSTLFVDLFKKWLTRTEPQSVRIVQSENSKAADEQAIVELRILQALMDSIPDRLVAGTTQLLDLVAGILADQAADSRDDVIVIALSLLNHVISAPGFQKARVHAEIIMSLEKSLTSLAQSPVPDIASTANNLSLLLRYRDELEPPTSNATNAGERSAEDRKTYNLAISYITQPDSPAPVLSEGINLMSRLIESQSPVLDIAAVLVLLSGLLRDNDDFINLRAVKVFTQLANRHPKAVTRELLDNYVDALEKETLDARLRFGEALSQVIERLGDTFAGETAQQVGEALLSTAGRRGFRPKTKARQERDARAQEAKRRKAAPADEASDIESDEEQTAEERASNAILEQIVQGWESKRGAEDVRIRASALSICTLGIETNIAGLGSVLVSSAVDLSLAILTLEPEVEKAIIRRAGLVLIQGFLRALADARESRKRIGFSLTPQSQADITRILNYVMVTDQDGLVKQHARDVLESLENWQALQLAPDAPEQEASAGLTRLAGLNIDPGASTTPQKLRPKIEELD